MAQLRPELVFMDIELQTGTGFDVLQKVRHLDFHLIFTTAFEHYAIKAIKFSSIDYLLKPIDLEELIASVQKAKKTNRIRKQAKSARKSAKQHAKQYIGKPKNLSFHL
ncbi:LytR/AlgR family response regulator transcription factor [Algoriphagus boritolerans]|uniref:LytR/AlgR family response regulator transcription factor n=1 Tax=Algoriphagus boritolerans TaxID=308111 RepID=UPI002FCE327E